MNSRTVLAASVSALAAVAVVVPSVHAQDISGGEDAGSPGSVASVGSGSAGSGGSGAGDGSLDGLAPEDDGAICELPGLGGSVAKFYPLFGDSEVPTAVMDFITTTLDSFPNILDIVAGAGAGTALLGQTGSLAEGLCTSIFGGEMVLPPVTVIVDEDGNPTTTITGTVAPEESDVPAPGSASTSGGGDAADGGSVGSLQAEGVSSLPTSVPTPESDGTGGDAVEN